MRRTLRTLAYTLLTGYLLAYYSEWMFWSGRVRSESLGDDLLSWLAYSFIAYLFLLTAKYFRARNLWAVFLAGAVYGWLVEGVLIQTMYDDFPLNLSFTGLAWHALITVVVGWYLLRRALRHSLRRALWISIGLGLFYGFWSSGWWVESPVVDPTAQLLHNLFLGILLVAAYAGLEALGSEAFQPRRAGAALAILLTVLYFVFVTAAIQPLALLIFPATVSIVLLFLLRNRRRQPTAAVPEPKPPAARFLVVLAIPLVASLVYALFYLAGFPIPTLAPITVILLPAGFIFLAISAYRLWKTPAA